MDSFRHALLAVNNTIIIGSDPAFSVSQTSTNSLFWPVVYKSSEWPEIDTRKPYFIIYSTDHDSGSGGIWWGEFDNFIGNKLNGFVENGLIISGDQSETPYLIRVPTSESGLTNDTIFLYYHTDGTEVGNDSKQQTRLITSTGGLLHSATWTDRGRPLGVVGTENHTGYLRVWKRGVNDYIGHHLYRGDDVIGGKASTSSDCLTFSRLLQFDGSEGMPSGGVFERSTLSAFAYNSTLYGIFKYTDNVGDRYLAIAELDSATYLPNNFIKTIYRTDARDVKTYFEGDSAYIFYKNGNTQPDTNDYYLVTYNLKDL